MICSSLDNNLYLINDKVEICIKYSAHEKGVKGFS